MPYLAALNINGMDPGGDRAGRKILPLGQGSRDLELLRTIAASGYKGPIGILGHTQDDAEERLKDNLDGLDWLVPQLDGHPAGPRPQPRTPVPPSATKEVKSANVPPPPSVPGAAAAPYDPALVASLIDDARKQGDPIRGAGVFASSKFACVSCHRVGDQGSVIGPDLSTVGTCIKPEEIVESLLWPRRQVKEAYAAYTIATSDGKTRQAYKVAEKPNEIVFRDPASTENFSISKSDIEEMRQDGSLMPEGLTVAMSTAERRDLIRFLFDLGHPGSHAAENVRRHSHVMAEFAYDRAPLHPEQWPNWHHACQS